MQVVGCGVEPSGSVGVDNAVVVGGREAGGGAAVCRILPVQRLRSRVQGAGFRVQGAGFRAQGSGFRVQGSGFRVLGSGCSACGTFALVLIIVYSSILGVRLWVGPRLEYLIFS